MLIDFFFTLKDAKIPVTIKEFLTLLEAMEKNLIGQSMDDFYFLSRLALVKDEAHFDKFDRAFAEFWNGVETIPGIEAQIQTATLPDGHVWHRVRVGPFSNQDELSRSRAALKENKLEANLIKVRE